MIQRFIGFEIRKNITKKNKIINHSSLVRSLNLTDRIPFLAKYHKKKLIAFSLAIIIMWTYDLHKYLMRKVLSMRSPLHFVQSFFVEQKKIPNTILEQNYAGVDLKPSTKNFLMKIYSVADKELYFGVGRYYLFHVYKDLGVIKTEEETKKFWQASGFYKERNQKASGVGMVEFLNIFEQGFQHAKKKQELLTEEQFLSRFAQKFIEKGPQILAWQTEFNRQRTKQFLKNMPGDNQKKKDAIIQIIRESTLKNASLLTEQEMEERIKQMGLKGMNLTDKMLFWQLKRTWDALRIVSIDKKIAHPLTIQTDKISLNKEKQQIMQKVRQEQQKMKEIEQNFQSLYQQKIF